MGVSLGLGLTNECNLACAHCYRPGPEPHRLSLADVQKICDSVDVGAVNLGTGENGLHPEFLQIVDFLFSRGIRVSLTSNGYSVTCLDDDRLRRFHDVEFSFDFAHPEGMDAFRGPGAWDLAMTSLKRCRGLGLEVTILAVMMAINYNRLPEVAVLADSVGCNFRVNVYQPVKSDRFTLTYEQFWEGFQGLFRTARVLACSEPLVSALLGLNTTAGPACGKTSLRVSPLKTVLPCVYWPAAAGTLASLVEDGAAAVWSSAEFERTRAVPPACLPCPHVHTCGGGCASRRTLRGHLLGPDEYCPIVRGETLALDVELARPKELLHAANYCTVVFSGLRRAPMADA